MTLAFSDVYIDRVKNPLGKDTGLTWEKILAALTAAFEADGVSPEQMPPQAALLLMTGLAHVLAIEEGLGVTSGHEDTVAFIEAAVARLDTRR